MRTQWSAGLMRRMIRASGAAWLIEMEGLSDPTTTPIPTEQRSTPCNAGSTASTATSLLLVLYILNEFLRYDRR